ncbi:MAG: ParB/RepB/Spo0J family partition protein [bacterium]|nr:ParB/RepB/Spo0J family partition protein [bacterium]
MDLEFHQLDLPHGDLRIRDEGRYGRLLASLVAQGQQVPVVVVSAKARYVLIDGYQRTAALRQMGRDKVEATLWPISEVDALVHHHHLSSSSSHSCFEEAWFLARLRECGLSLDELAKRLCRTKSWVSRRLGLVSALSETVQGKVREGVIPAHAAMRYLVPLARANKRQCETLVNAIGNEKLSSREVGKLYAGWGHADAVGRRRLCEAPFLYLRAMQAKEAEKPATDDPGTKLVNELATLGSVAWRARQQVHQGLDFESTYKRIDLCAAWRTAQDAFDELAGALQKALFHAGSDDSNRHSQAS